MDKKIIYRISLLLLFSFVFLLFSILNVHASSGNAEGLRIDQKIDLSGQVPTNLDESVTYRLFSVDGAPLPNGSSKGVYTFTLRGDCSYILDLSQIIDFERKEEYKYVLTADSPVGSLLKLDHESCSLQCLVLTGNQVELFAVDEASGKKISSLLINPVFEGKPVEDGRVIGNRDVTRPRMGDRYKPMLIVFNILFAGFGIIFVLQRKNYFN